MSPRAALSRRRPRAIRRPIQNPQAESADAESRRIGWLEARRNASGRRPDIIKRRWRGHARNSLHRLAA